MLRILRGHFLRGRPPAEQENERNQPGEHPEMVLLKPGQSSANLIHGRDYSSNSLRTRASLGWLAVGCGRVGRAFRRRFLLSHLFDSLTAWLRLPRKLNNEIVLTQRKCLGCNLTWCESARTLRTHFRTTRA